MVRGFYGDESHVWGLYETSLGGTKESLSVNLAVLAVALSRLLYTPEDYIESVRKLTQQVGGRDLATSAIRIRDNDVTDLNWIFSWRLGYLPLRSVAFDSGYFGSYLARVARGMETLKLKYRIAWGSTDER
jgi:hypothetical protein